MIEQKNIKRTFANGSKRYLVDNFIWKKIDRQFQKKRPNHIKRYQHTISVLNDNLFLFGGTLHKIQSQKILYSISLKSHQWRGWTINQKYFRNSHSAVTYQNSLYFFGGNDLENEYNDIKKFEPNFNKWTQFQNNGDIPPPRSRAIMLVYLDYLFLLGGMNTITGQIYQDAYIWKNSHWSKLVLENQPSPRINYKIAKCGMKIFMFGGESTAQQQQYYNELYELAIDINELKLTFIKVSTQSDYQPKQRSSHCMISLSDNFFILIGGETKDKNMDINLLGRPLRDVWVFDIINSKWIQIDPKNGPLKYISNSDIIQYKNVLYMFGGIDEKGRLTDDLLTIKFGEDQILKSEICAWCHERVKKIIQQKEQFPKIPSLSIGFLYNLSLDIKFPFQAIALLIDSAIKLSAQKFNINYMKTMTDLIYLDIQFDGNTFSKEQFYSFISHTSYGSQLNPNIISRNIILGSFRLGKTLLFITSDSKTRKVFLISADSKIIPVFDETYTYFAYIQDIQTGNIQSHDGLIYKNYIVNVLSAQLSNPYDVLHSKNINRLLILSHNCIMSINKIYYSELVSLKANDIKIYKNPKKIDFLQQAGFNISNNPQISLNSYLSLLYRNCQLNITLNECGESIKFQDYESTLQKMCSQKLIVALQTVECPPNIKISLYMQLSQQINHESNGILIYNQNRLINRYECEFGNIFKQKFYRNRYKKLKNIWKILGIIIIENNQNLKLNILKTSFIKTSKSFYTLSNIDQLIRKCIQNNRNKYQLSDSSDNQKITKKIKIQ